MTTSEKWATFKVDNEMFSLRVEDVQEVLRPQRLTPVPLAPVHIMGLLNLRGQIMNAVCLRRRLGMRPRADDQPGNLLVVKAHGRLVSIVVDEIGDVLELPKDAWRPPPPTLAASHRAFVQGICPIESGLVLGLRVDSLSGDEEV